MTVCLSHVAKPGSIQRVPVCACVCETGLKERVHNWIRLCYLVDSPRLCLAVAQMLTVCI